MKKLEEILKNKKLIIDDLGYDGGTGRYFYLGKIPLTIVFSWGGYWDHVSVSYAKQCPTWAEMCIIKDVFWDAEETVIQYHPKKSNYINNHPYVLHMWKPQNAEIVTPPLYMV